MFQLDPVGPLRLHGESSGEIPTPLRLHAARVASVDSWRRNRGLTIKENEPPVQTPSLAEAKHGEKKYQSPYLYHIWHHKSKKNIQNLAPNIYLQFILGTIAYPMFRTTHVRLWVPGTQRYSNTRDEFAGKHLTKRGTQIHGSMVNSFPECDMSGGKNISELKDQDPSITKEFTSKLASAKHIQKAILNIAHL